MALRWSELAVWRGPTSQHGGAMIEQRGLIIHIAEGSFEGTISWQKGPNSVSSHFVVAGPADLHDGQIAQVVDLDVTAWTQQQGNGHWLSSENSGFSPHALSAAQVEANAKLYARGMKEFGWPARLATSPADKGLAYHGLACVGSGGDPRAPWAKPNTTGQVWGHCDCPGAGVIAQLPAILDRAIQINSGGGDVANVYIIDSSDQAWDGKYFVSNGVHRRPLRNPGGIISPATAGMLRTTLTDAMRTGVSASETWDSYLTAVAGPEAPGPAPACPDCNCSGTGGVTEAEAATIADARIEAATLHPGA